MRHGHGCRSGWTIGVITSVLGASLSAARAELTWFADQTAFEAFNSASGRTLEFTETYEEAVLPAGAAVGLDDPLQAGVANLNNGRGFPSGLSAAQLLVQSNLNGADSAFPNPRGSRGLGLAPAGFVGTSSKVVQANFSGDSLDLNFVGDNKLAVGFDAVSILSGAGSVVVRAYDTDNSFLGMMSTPADAAGSNFIGIASTDPIGRINIWDPSSGGASGYEGGDNIQMWVPEPAGGLLLVLGMLCGSYRRRS